MGFKLEILTPFGTYAKFDSVDYLSVPSSNSVLGILPNHAPLVADVILGEISITIDNNRDYYATSGGIIYVKKDKTILLLNSIEHGNEIDLERANLAKDRAEKRLSNSNKNLEIDELRAKASLYRALNRIKVATKYYSQK